MVPGYVTIIRLRPIFIISHKLILAIFKLGGIKKHATIRLGSY